MGLGSGIQGSKRHRIPDPDPQHWLLEPHQFGSGPTAFQNRRYTYNIRYTRWINTEATIILKSNIYVLQGRIFDCQFYHADAWVCMSQVHKYLIFKFFSISFRSSRHISLSSVLNVFDLITFEIK
jgi:hypothetical protein